MAYALRNLFLRSKYFKQSADGMLASFTCAQNSHFNSFILFMIKGSVVKLFPKTFCSYDDFKHLKDGFKRSSHFDLTHLPGLNMASTVTEGKLLNAVHRISKAYSKELNHKNFHLHFKEFLESRSYNVFCKILENKLPQISPPGLIFLYEYIDSKLLSQKILNKICVVIMETINNFRVLEKLHLYVRVLEKGSQNVESNKVKKLCETYFEKCFETELNRLGFSMGLLNFTDSEVLPMAIRKLIVKKLLDHLYKGNSPQLDQIKVLVKLISVKNDVLPKNELKEVIRHLVKIFTSGRLLIEILKIARKVGENNYCFDIEDMERIVTRSIPLLNKQGHLISFIRNVCLLGYMNDHLLKIVVDKLLVKSILECRYTEVNSLLEVIVRSSFQDTQPEEKVDKVRRQFALFSDFQTFTFKELCFYCENLTYLGVDTRSICSVIFDKVTEDFVLNISERNVLFLHHLAKVCLSNGYEVLSEKILDKVLQVEFENTGALPGENLNEYFGSEDYVLRNCTTSDKHCLHFVAIFGPDNKPIDLSMYKKKSESRNKFLNIDEIDKPQGYKMIAFQKFLDPQPIKFLNRPLISGIAKKYLKIFENLNCNIILLPVSVLFSTPEKKEQFLRLRIKDVTDNVEMKRQQYEMAKH